MSELGAVRVWFRLAALGAELGLSFVGPADDDDDAADASNPA